jgi:hypothetical protein
MLSIFNTFWLIEIPELIILPGLQVFPNPESFSFNEWYSIIKKKASKKLFYSGSSSSSGLIPLSTPISSITASPPANPLLYRFINPCRLPTCITIGR